MKALKHFLIKLGLFPGTTLEEQLNNILLEQKRRNFLDDITRIRNAGDYIPDYNAAPKFAEYHLTDKNGEIKWQPKVSAQPKQKFNTMNEWKEAIRLEAKKLNTKDFPVIQLNILFSN